MGTKGSVTDSRIISMLQARGSSDLNMVFDTGNGDVIGLNNASGISSRFHDEKNIQTSNSMQTAVSSDLVINGRNHAIKMHKLLQTKSQAIDRRTPRITPRQPTHDWTEKLGQCHDDINNEYYIITLNNGTLRKKLCSHVRGQGREADPHYLAKKRAYTRAHNFNAAPPRLS